MTIQAPYLKLLWMHIGAKEDEYHYTRALSLVQNCWKPKAYVRTIQYQIEIAFSVRSFGQILISPHQEGNAIGLGGLGYVKAVCLHYGTIVCLMCFQQLGWHCQRVI